MVGTEENPGKNILIREYRDSDETAWVRTRVLAFLDTSYRDDVQLYRERYENPAVCQVAIDTSNNSLVGLIDVEYERKCGQVCNFAEDRGGVIWHLAVLPEYRNQGIAHQLWQTASAKLQEQGIARVQVWTQDDEAASRWYESKGFVLTHRHLNVFSRGPVDEGPIKYLLRGVSEEWKFGQIRILNFEADVKDRAELEALSYRIHEVRGLELELSRP